MKTTILQRGHSHASCCNAMALAAKALLQRVPDDPEKMRELELTDEELQIVKDVIAKFGGQDKERKADSAE